MALFNKDNKTKRLLLEKARRLERPKPALVFNAAALSTAGACVCAPVLLGLILGDLFEKLLPLQGFSWVLHFILLGFLGGVICLGFWLKREEKKLLLAQNERNGLKKTQKRDIQKSI